MSTGGGPPQHTPFGAGSFARAVQAYSISRLGGGTLAQAEAAARAACPGCVIPDVAQASAGARTAAANLFGTTPNAARGYGVNAAKATGPGSGVRVVTVRVQYQPGGAMGLSMGLQPQWRTIQVDVPVGANAGQARLIVEGAAGQLIEHQEADYPGTILAMDAVTVIGV